MKKLLLSFLVLTLAIFFLLNLAGCQKLKISNLSANKHLKEGNKFYVQEKFRQASEEYEKALEKNPDLKVVYLYLGTCYSTLYKPGKDTERNKAYSENAIKFLLKAEEAFPEQDNVIIALGSMYDKLGNFDEAEKYFLKILEKAADDPKAYYTLANFYSQNGKYKKAEEMYKKRIELDPSEPSAYHYFAVYLQNYRMWDDAIDAHRKRIFAMIDVSLLDYFKNIDKIKADMTRISDINKYIRNVEKNKAIPAETRKQLTAEKKKELENFPTIEEAINQIKTKEIEMNEAVAVVEAKLAELSDEEKLKLAEAYYSLGVVAWNKSYQTPVDEDILPGEERRKAIEFGFKALNKAIELSPEYPNPYSYMGLLWREMIKVDPSKSEEFIKKNEEFNKKFKDIYVKRKKREDYLKELEELEK